MIVKAVVYVLSNPNPFVMNMELPDTTTLAELGQLQKDIMEKEAFMIFSDETIHWFDTSAIAAMQLMMAKGSA